MKILILYVLLAAYGSGDPTIHLNSREDFGLYCSADTAAGKISITVKATYFVQRGNAEDMAALKYGIAFWHNENNNYYLLSDSSGPKGPVEFPIHFDLKFEIVDNPEKQKKKFDDMLLSDKGGGRLINTLRVVNRLRQCPGRNDNLDSASGLTCGESMMQIKRADSITYGIVVAHEIGHTLGIVHNVNNGLMYAYNKGNNLLYESDILQILKYSFEHQGNLYRNRFDNKITTGRIRHYFRENPLMPDAATIFSKVRDIPKSND